MAHAYIRNGVINVRWRNAPGKTPKWPSASLNPNTGRPFKSEKEAEDWGDEMEVKARLGLLDEPEPEPEDDDITVNEWFARWWPGIDVGLRSNGTYEYLFRAHVLPEWGEWALADITASKVNAWERRMIEAGYERDGVPNGARTRLSTLLGDAVTEGLIGSNPALRQRHRGRRSGVGTGGRSQEKYVISPFQMVALAERMGIATGRDDEFVFGLLLGWTGVRWAEGVGLQRKYVRLGKVRVDWQLLEYSSNFYLLPPKDDSNRDIDIPPFLQHMLNRLIAANPDRTCRCRPKKIPGQREQPCQGGGAFVFLGEDGGHLRNSNFARRVFDPAADGQYAASKKGAERRPVLVELDSGWPGRPIPPWPRAVRGQQWERPASNSYRGRPLGLGINSASLRSELVAYAIGQGVPEAEAREMTRQQIIDRFVRSHRVAEDAAVASWTPIDEGMSPHDLRHWQSTLIHGEAPMKLRDDRMGHVSPDMRGMRDRYTDILPEWRVELRGFLQRVWDQALAERAWFGLHSPVTMLDDFLAPFRSGERKPIAPFESPGEVLAFPTKNVG